MNINKEWPAHISLYEEGKCKNPEWIVIHFVGDAGVPAINFAKCNHYRNCDRNASWNAIVGLEGEVFESVAPGNAAWHCGDNGIGKFKGKCTNYNSLGVEHCFIYKNGKAAFTESTLKSSVELVKKWMKDYCIPLDHVIRHYDVTNKNCPTPFLYNDGEWEKYLNMLSDDKSDIDEQLFNAVSRIIKSGISLEFNKWKREDLMKIENVKYLIPKLARINFDECTEEIYLMGIDILYDIGIISDYDLWKYKKYKSKNVRSLLLKYADNID